MKAAVQAVATQNDVFLVPLAFLKAGQSGRVGEVLGAGDMVHRLREMGLYDGAQVRMIRPGSPCIIGLHGQRLGFRADDLARVMVRVSAAAS
jgi:ferrous iron transport protein A